LLISTTFEILSGLSDQVLMSNPVSLQTSNPKRTNLKMYEVLLSVFLALKQSRSKKNEENTFVYFVQQKVCSFKYFCVFKRCATKGLGEHTTKGQYTIIPTEYFSAYQLQRIIFSIIFAILRIKIGLYHYHISQYGE